MTNTNICAYCGQSRLLTKEHIYPDFFKQFFNTHAIITDKLKIHNFPIKPLDITINDVCKDCNNDELAKLDRYGKSIIKQIIHTPDNSLHYEYPTLLRWLLKFQYNIERYYTLESPLPTPAESIIKNTSYPTVNLYIGRFQNNHLSPKIVGFKDYPHCPRYALMLIFNSVFFVISKTDIDDDSLIKIDPEKNEIPLIHLKGLDYLKIRASSSILYPEILNRKIKSIISITKESAEITQSYSQYQITVNVHLPANGEIVLNRFENTTQIAFIPINSEGKDIIFFETKQSRKKWTSLIKNIQANSGTLRIVATAPHPKKTIDAKVTMINGTVESFN